MTQRGMKPTHCDRLAELICRVLTSIETFGIPAIGGTRGRGKIEASVVETTRKDASDFIAATCVDLHPARRSHRTEPQKTPSVTLKVRRGAGIEMQPSLEGSEDISVLHLQGERLRLFLQAVCTADVSDLKPGDVCRGAMLAADASLVAYVLIVWDEPSKYGEPRAKILVDASRAKKLAQWLLHLSDGFTKFDEHDIFAKIDGPIVVRPFDTGALHDSGGMAGTLREISDDIVISVCGEKEAGIVRAFVKSARDIQTPDALALVKRLEGGETFALSKPYFIGQRKLIETLYFPRAHHGSRPTGTTCGMDAGPVTLVVRGKLHLDKKLFKWEPSAIEPRKSCLYEEHLKLTKKRNIIEFAGWLMPALYSGIMDEHHAVRTDAALFDVSHMGVFDFRGPYAQRFLDVLTTNYVVKLRPGQSQYSYVLDEGGSVLDDVMVYRLTPERFLMVANAVNAEKIQAWMKAVNSREFVIDRAYPFKELEHPCEFRYLKDPAVGADMLVDLALQGPRSLAILDAVARQGAPSHLDADAGPTVPVSAIKRSELTQVMLGETPAIVSRTGYTGEEFGYELFVHPAKAPAVWNLLLRVGKDFGLKPAGLGARDSTRTEAGLPLYGHELASHLHLSPLEAGYGAFVKRHKPFFIGKRPLLEREAKVTSEIIRFRVASKGARVVRTGDAVVNRKGQYVGTVTSASLDTDGFQTGMAYVVRACTTEGTWLGIFSGKQQEAAHPATRKLEPGGRVPLHDEAIVLPRFQAQAIGT
jgi:glycine hydroxymethyltransferase